MNCLYRNEFVRLLKLLHTVWFIQMKVAHLNHSHSIIMVSLFTQFKRNSANRWSRITLYRGTCEPIAIEMPLCVVQSAFRMMVKLQHWKLPNNNVRGNCIRRSPYKLVSLCYFLKLTEGAGFNLLFACIFFSWCFRRRFAMPCASATSELINLRNIQSNRIQWVIVRAERAIKM